MAEGRGVALWVEGLKHQIYLGDADFVRRMQALAAQLGLTVGRVSQLIAWAEQLAGAKG